MKRKLLILAFIFIALLGFLAFSFSRSDMIIYEENYGQKTVNGVVYAPDEKGFYYVKDFFATEEIAQNTTEINIVSEIDGVPVKSINPRYLFSESYPGVDIVTIEEGIEYIGEKAFSVLDGVKKISLPETVTEIGKGAFSEMESLTEVTLPSEITAISDDMFLSCPRLINVNISDKITSVGAYAFAGCRILSSFHIPESVKFIGEAAFRGAGLTYIHIPSSVSFAEEGSIFKGCTSLKKAEFSDRDDEAFAVNEYLFSGCSALEEVVLPEAQDIVICKGAFENCKELKTIKNSESISCIGSMSFYNCGLERINLPAGIEFKDREKGVAAVSVFENSQKLRRVIFETDGNTGDLVLAEQMFKDCTVLSRVMLPLTEGEITISDRAFEGCQSLLGVYNTYSVSFIGEEAFSGCVSLELFVLPERMTSVSAKAFYGCKRLGEVYLHKSIKEIGDSAFNKCEKLTDIYFEGTSEDYAEVVKGRGSGLYKNKIRYDSAYYPLMKNVRAELSRGSARLSWEQDGDAEGYRVYVVFDNVLLKKVADIKDTEYTFGNLIAEQEYDFSVRAYYMEEGERILGPQKEIVAVIAE